MKVEFKPYNFSDWRSDMIEQADKILKQFKRDGYDLTLRGLYYQFVGNDLFPDRWKDPKTGSTNNQKSYDKLGVLMMEARYGGYIDWEHLKDITRELSGGHGGWDSPKDVIETYADYFSKDLWEGMSTRVEVWVEKDALENVVSRACNRYRVPYFSCRGFVSATSLQEAARRFEELVDNGQDVLVLQLCDLDPSGWDMTRDITNRLQEFLPDHYESVKVKRIGLNIQQVRELALVPNPAKITDSKAGAFIKQFGNSSYELDAVKPQTLDRWITEAIEEVLERDVYDANLAEEQKGKDQLKKLLINWEEVTEFLEEL